MNKVTAPDTLDTLVVFETRAEDVEGNLHLGAGNDGKFYLYYEGGTFTDGSDYLCFARKSDAFIRAVQLTSELLDLSDDVEVFRT